MGITQHNYPQDQVEAAKAVLLELTRLLSEYRDEIVLVGGWVPGLLYPGHIGSIDIDLALDHRRLQEAGYRTIEELLLSREYRKDLHQPFIFYRNLTINNKSITVEVDFLAGEYAGTGLGHRTQRIQDINARKARGCDLAFDLPQDIIIQGHLPDGGMDSATIRVASIVPFIVMKAMALADRLKEKDAYDLYFCLTQYPGGIERLVDDFRPHRSHGLIQEALQKLADKFASPAYVGPTFVADFLMVTDAEERAYIQRDAYERIQYLITAVLNA